MAVSPPSMPPDASRQEVEVPSAAGIYPPGRPEPPRSTLRREWLLLALALCVLAAVVAPPLINLGRYQHRIVDAMSRSLGRSVTMGAITLRLLPMPALVLTDVVVNEDPAFGVEPALRAPDVVAVLRLTSLWRGRFEVSRVEVTGASVNLVRNSSGRWNIGSVLLQASHIANAPTGQRHPGLAPRFPYIDITDSRVNLKEGVEKLPYSLQNANLSMWLAQPDLWQLRLDAQPIRTDIELGLADTGVLRMEGTLHRATALGRMPLALHADWVNAPLGQASRLVMGRDGGWSGDLHASADVTGEPDSLDVKTHVAIANLHREEFSPAEPFTVDATCGIHYSRAAHLVSGINCHWPVGSGSISLAGSLSLGDEVPGIANRTNGSGRDEAKTRPSVAGGAQAANHRGVEGAFLQLGADRLPASFLLAAAALTRSDFAPAFRAEGSFSGTFDYSRGAGQAPLLTGGLGAPLLSLVVDSGSKPLTLMGAQLTASSSAPLSLTTISFTTSTEDLGSPSPTLLDAQLTAQGLSLHASGVASLARVEELGRATHLLPAALGYLAPQGTTEFDLTRNIGWEQEAGSPASNAADVPSGHRSAIPAASESSFPTVLLDPAAPASGTVTHGWLRLHNAKYAPGFLPESVLLASAQATFLPSEIAWTVPAAIFRRTTIQVTAHSPTVCAPAACVTRFHAAAGSIDAGELQAAVLGVGIDGVSANQHLFEQLLSRLASHASHWPALTGTVHADTFTIGRLALHALDTEVTIQNGQVRLGTLDAQALGGVVHGEGVISLDGRLPTYALNTVLSHASASAAGEVLHETWGQGLLTLSSELKLSGLRTADFSDSASGRFHAEWTHGGLGGETPLARFTDWTGEGVIGNHALTFTSSRLMPASSAALPRTESLPVQGSIGFDRALGLQIEHADGPGHSDAVTGTLAHPVE